MQTVLEQTLLYTGIHAFAFFRPEIGITEILEKQFIQRWSSKSGRIASSKLGADFRNEIAGCHPIGCRIPKYVVTVLPDASRHEQPLTNVHLRLGKAGIRGEASLRLIYSEG